MQTLKLRLNPMDLEVESFAAPAAASSAGTTIIRKPGTDLSCADTCNSGGAVCCA
jgi:hypothetical protein